jgi:dinuclear metal center YbgI/SA1388 family protein
VGRIVATVDSSLAAIEGLGPPSSPDAVPSPPLLIVHHGMFWDGNQPVTGRRYRKIRTLIEHDAALYAAHMPLDVHPEVGNNAVLAQRLSLHDRSWFGMHKGIAIGVAGQAPDELRTRDAVVQAVGKTLGIPTGTIRVIPAGPERVTRIGVITGAAGSAIAQAHAAGCDTYITGEGAAHTYHDATELGLNVLFAGHYATETVGIQALARHLGERFGLPWEFHDHPTGM